MSTEQAFTRSEIEALLHTVCKEVLTGTLDADRIWKDKPDLGQKPEPYLRINVRVEPDRHGPYDPSRASSPADPDDDAVLHTTKSRTLEPRIDVIGAESYDIAQILADKIQLPEYREILNAKGVGLCSVKGPAPVPYNEGSQRKEYHRVILSLHLLETSLSTVNFIKYLEVRSDQLGIPEETIELTGG